LTEVYEYIGGIAEWSAFGLPLDGDDADTLTAGDLARRDFPTCQPDERAGDLKGRFGEHTVCAVVDRQGVFLGRLRRSDADKIPDSVASELMTTGASTFRPDVAATEMAQWFGKRNLNEFFITTPDGKVFGILYKSPVEHVTEHLDEQ
jgi:CBS-domain-containing membrane protein